MRIAIVRMTADVEDLDCSRLAIGINVWLHSIVCPELGLDPACHQATFFPDPSKVVGDGVMPIEATPPQDGVGGYHDESGDMPYLPIFTRPLGTSVVPMFTGPSALSVSGSHEFIETLKDPYVNAWRDMPDGVTELCEEESDPTEGPTETVSFGPGAGDTMAVANFVLNKFWDPQAGPLGKPPGVAGGAQRFDRLGRLTSSFSKLDTGYMIKRKAGPGGQEWQEFGERMPSERRQFLEAHPRRARRGARTSIARLSFSF